MINFFCRTNTQSSEVEIQHIKHRDIATTKEMEAWDDIDGDENIYETMNEEHEMSTCVAYGTLKI